MESKNDVEQMEASDRLSISEKVMEGDVDAAVATVKDQDLAFTPEGKSKLRTASQTVVLTLHLENRRVLRKIDWHLVPLMAFACGIQLVDKVRLICVWALL